MRKNKEIRAEAVERVKPIKKKLMLYTLVWLLLVSAINAIPFVSIAGSFLSPFFALGFIVTVLNVFRGNGENESPVSFFPHTFEYFKKTFFSYLWLILKCIVGLVLIIIAAVMLTTTNVVMLGSEIGSVKPSEMGSATLGIVSIVAAVLYFVGIIVLIVKVLDYQAISYEIIHSDPNKPAKEIVNDAKEHMKGHVGQWFCMSLYYGLKILIMYFVLAIVVSIIVAALQNAIVGTVSTILLVVFLFYLMINIYPQMICSCELLFKEMVGDGEQNNPEQYTNS